jgi:Flp pilus assembly pilin Flp
MPSTNQELARLVVEHEGGQTAAEYAVVLGLITLAIVASYAALSGAIQGLFEKVAGLFS